MSRFDVKPSSFLDLHLDPEALTVKAVLEALVKPLHRAVAKEHVLVRSTPGVVNAHGVVGSDRAVYERCSLFGALIAAQVLFDDAILLPERENLALKGWKVHLRTDRIEHRCTPFQKEKLPPQQGRELLYPAVPPMFPGSPIGGRSSQHPRTNVEGPPR